MSYYSKKRTKRAILIALFIGVLFLLLFLTYEKRAKEEVVVTTSEEVQTERKLSNTPSKISVDPNQTNTLIYTSYRLGIRFSFSSLYSTVRDQECPESWSNCPKIYANTSVVPPVEEDNSITFADYRLEVFDKRSDETIEQSIARNIFPADDPLSCVINRYPSNSDNVVKANLVPNEENPVCQGRYFGTKNGKHFFTYPAYPNILLYVEGPIGTPVRFSHSGTWIGSIKISQ